MSLDKAISHGKEHRKQYRGCKLFDPSCRNHGNCVWCQRKYKRKQIKDIPLDDEWQNEKRDAGKD